MRISFPNPALTRAILVKYTMHTQTHNDSPLSHTDTLTCSYTLSNVSNHIGPTRRQQKLHTHVHCKTHRLVRLTPQQMYRPLLSPFFFLAAFYRRLLSLPLLSFCSSPLIYCKLSLTLSLRTPSFSVCLCHSVSLIHLHPLHPPCLTPWYPTAPGPQSKDSPAHSLPACLPSTLHCYPLLH